MRILKLAVAAAIAFGTIGVVTVPAQTAEAQRDWRGDRRRGWRGYRGRHYGWRNRRVCRWVWRYGHRQRVCRHIRVRYWR